MTTTVHTDLITPALAKSDPDVAFQQLPAWATTWTLVDTEEAAEDPRLSPTIAVVLGKKLRVSVTMTALQFALLLHCTALGHSVATNSNHAKAHPRIYAKFIFRDAAQDNTPIGRLFAAAIEHEAESMLDNCSDLRPVNLAKTYEGRPKKDAVELLKHHVRRLVRERELGGTLPEGFSVQAYLDNLEALLLAVEVEREAHLSPATEQR
ncbi:hypothetical protein [Rhizobium alvei]|uniref:Uncharacterized protein n=1 Tax=Rhizobium alvei TaxID=1132659 RepID=A0ABT8YR44_9HYPH|nr:hypothetical protein [Rhizobium alvei]MDO6965782.1 hypothetical protein [Rhizobium alvei]